MKITRIWKIRVNLSLVSGWRTTGIFRAEKNARSSEIRWVLDSVNLLTVFYNKFVPGVSTSSVSLCGRVNFLCWKVIFPLLRVNISRVNFQCFN